MPIELYCGLLHVFEIVFVPFVYTGILFAFLWGLFQYITRGDYDLYHTLGAKSQMLWASLFLGILMLVFSVTLLALSMIGITNTSCGF
jgi:hypothetical protein